jgi:histidine decarboxylase
VKDKLMVFGDDLAGLLPEDGGLSASDRQRLDRLEKKFSDLVPVSVGYPCNQAWDYGELHRFLKFISNNIGDPWSGSNFPQNTHDFEREVVAMCTGLADGKAGEIWGYVTSGGTEGNMYGLYVARELHPEGVCYFCEHTHYSVAKILRMQHTRSIMLRAQPDGQIDYDDLEESIKLHRDRPPILFLNAGTTMTGAIDQVARVREIIDRLRIRDSYLHVDAALSGMILPFVEDPPDWNFRAGIDSLSISGHKLLGAPIPCGVVLARRAHVERIAQAVEYVGVEDTTVLGSRSAFAPLLMWYRLRTLGRRGMRALANDCLDVARSGVESFRSRGIPAWRHRHSITVVIPRPPKPVFEKWVLAPYGDMAHIVTVPAVSKSTMEQIAEDCRAAWESTGDTPPPVRDFIPKNILDSTNNDKELKYA